MLFSNKLLLAFNKEKLTRDNFREDSEINTNEIY